MNKPLKRTIRQLIDGTYSDSGNSLYLLHPQFANDPQHYIRAYLIIQKDLLALFEFVEPCDKNSETVSLKIHELLVRTCIEIEANFTAILKENIYTNLKNWNLKDDYSLVDFTHKLSSYEVEIPIWKGLNNVRKPFINWKDKSQKNWQSLTWYKAYNKSKHDRHTHFEDATFENLINAVSGLVVLLTSQFMDEEYSPRSKSLSLGQSYSYNANPEMEDAIGSFFRIKYPNDWLEEDKYQFEWREIKDDQYPIEQINYNLIKLRGDNS